MFETTAANAKIGIKGEKTHLTIISIYVTDERCYYICHSNHQGCNE